MKIIDSIAARFGYVRKAAKDNPRAIVVRGYGMAKTGRLNSDWLAESTTEDRTLRSDMVLMRDRARDLARDDDYAKRFLGMCETNIAGPGGFRFCSEVVNSAGKPDERARDIIEDEFELASQEEAFSACGQFNRAQIEQLACVGVPRDGEFLLRLVLGYDNPWGFAVQVLEPEMLDHQLNIAQLPNGNRVTMGVEKNRWGRPVAYWLHDVNPNDDWTQMVSRRHTRWDADQIAHLFVPWYVTQSRGVTWFHTAGERMHMLRKWEDAAVVNARAGASKMGFLETVPDKDGNYPGAEEKDDGEREIEIAPGIVEDLPSGKRFVPFNPDYPNENTNDFRKGMLRGASSGLLVSYHALANDLEGVNYSSARVGVLEDREVFKLFQNWFSSRLSRKVFRAWLKMAILTGRVKQPMSQFERLAAHCFEGRRWAWVDPLKDLEASKLAVDLRVKSRSSIIAEMGSSEFEDVMRDFKYEGELAKEAGVELEVSTDGKQSPVDQPEEGDQTVS